jgi:N-acetylglucosaminyldiphosphoundecaprenol N-acetyl-beta-D-mannosaminyltransferase
VETGSGGNIFNINVHALNLAYHDLEFRRILNHADLVFVDGAGVQLGATLAGVNSGERLTFMDWMDDLFKICTEQRWPLFLLGDSIEMGNSFRRTLAEKHPHCPFAGHHHGFFDKSGKQNAAVVRQINASGAVILLVGMSMPIQEKWIWANREKLRPAVRLSSGGFHRVYTGAIPRGPQWMTQNGLEWLYRLSQQPAATWRRYLVGNPLFLYRVIRQRLFG